MFDKPFAAPLSDADRSDAAPLSDASPPAAWQGHRNSGRAVLRIKPNLVTCQEVWARPLPEMIFNILRCAVRVSRHADMRRDAPRGRPGSRVRTKIVPQRHHLAGAVSHAKVIRTHRMRLGPCSHGHPWCARLLTCSHLSHWHLPRAGPFILQISEPEVLQGAGRALGYEGLSRRILRWTGSHAVPALRQGSAPTLC